MFISTFNPAKTIVATFARTEVISVEQNTAKEFKAVLKDNMGTYKAHVRRLKQNKVIVNFEGADKRTLDVEYARWEYEAIWSDLAEQNNTVKAMA